MGIQNLNEATKSALPVLIFLFSIRIAGVGITLFTGENPYAQADVSGFIASAEAIAIGLQNGNYVYVDRPSAYQRWGTVIAPFWLLPGPSVIYSSISNAFIGSLAVYNVYIIARYYHSRYAAVLTTLPLMMYPSIVLIHSTLLREAFVLFGITLATRMLIIPCHQHRSRNLIIAIVGLTVAALLRPDNIPVYLIAVGAGSLVYAYRLNLLRRPIVYLGMSTGSMSILLFFDHIQNGIAYLGELREIRARGRTAYLVDVYATKIPEAIAFSWIGVAYFLCSPFPWMISTISDLIVGIEALINLFFVFIAPLGFRILFHRNPAGTVGLAVGLVAGVVLYGLGTANVGTAVRHRQMFMWAVFLLGGIGLAEHIRIKDRPDRDEI